MYIHMESLWDGIYNRTLYEVREMYITRKKVQLLNFTKVSDTSEGYIPVQE